MPVDIEQIENFLDIEMPESGLFQMDSSRRITGPGMIWDKRGALIDVLVGGFDKAAVVAAWIPNIQKILSDLNWHESEITSRLFEDGVTLVMSAPADLLYSAVFVIETSWHLTASQLLEQTSDDYDRMLSDLREVIALEANPALIRLLQAADSRNIDILSDDDFVSLGHGNGAQTWGVNELPAPDAVNWDQLHNLPVALITGTNGKSTSVRLATAVGEAAGLVSGSTSTDYVKLGNDILDYGDYSGPGGARMLLRDKRLELAFLEVARGGILRRGLPLFQARAALVTNIAADHLGQYGVNTVEALAQAKFAVARAVAEDGVLVLNADDPLVVENGLHFQRAICWFSLSANNERVREALALNTACCWLDDQNIRYHSGTDEELVLPVADIPITMNGAARFNVQNAMGVIGLGKAMGLSSEAIVKGLTEFTASPDDNPGRCNEFMVHGARVFVDFAHNPHAIAAMSLLLENLPARKKYLLISHAGDRTDQEITELTSGALGFQPDEVVIAELEDYLRGRELGDVPGLIAKECGRQGISSSGVTMMRSPGEGVEHILDSLEAGDVALLLALSDRDRIFELIAAAQD